VNPATTAPRIYDWDDRKGAKPIDPALDGLVRDIIGKVADKWTMLILEALNDHGTLRFSEVGRTVGDISQKMLTKTLRQMEADGLVQRVVHPVIPPHVDYSLTAMGRTLGGAFCGVWLWAEAHHQEIEASRKAFSERNGAVD
jgi:DNA-binding HxlR family transcriptional regulator